MLTPCGQPIAPPPVTSRNVAVGSLTLVIPMPVRDDLRALEGYHSPQVDVEVRLNTNESPDPPPAALARRVRRRAVAASSGTATPTGRRPALRAAIAELARRATRPGVRRQRLERGAADAAARVRRARAAPSPRSSRRTSCTATSPASPAPTVVEGERRADFTLDPAEVDRRRSREPQPDGHVPVLAEQPDRARRAAGRRATPLLDAAPGLVVVDEAYAQFADWSALDLVDEDRPLVVVRTFSKTWSMAAARLGYLVGPTWLVAELDKVVLPYHLDAAKQIAGRLALRFVDEMDERVQARSSPSASASATALPALPVDVVPERRQLRAVPAAPTRRAATCGKALVDRSVLVRDCSGWPRLDDCLRVTVGTPDENDALPRRARARSLA